MPQHNSTYKIIFVGCSYGIDFACITCGVLYAFWMLLRCNKLSSFILTEMDPLFPQP